MKSLRPITKLKVDIELQRLIEEEEMVRGCVGSLRSAILRGLANIIDTMWDVSPVQSAFEVVPTLRRYQTPEGLPPWRRDLGCDVHDGLLIECEVIDDKAVGMIRRWVWFDRNWHEVGPALGRD